MSADLPRPRDLRRGLTVEIEQEDGDRLVGEIQRIFDDEHPPEGVKVRLEQGATGRVKGIHPDE